MKCPTHSMLDQFHRRRLSPVASRIVQTHLEQCCNCQDRSQQLQTDLAFESQFIDSAHVRPAPEQVLDDLQFTTQLIDLSFVARGGLSAVYRATDPDSGRCVAIKVMRDDHAASEERRQRFDREYQLTGKLNHPGISHTLGRGILSDGRPYYVMPFLEGQTLRQLIAEMHQDDVRIDRSSRVFREILEHFCFVCETIEYAHQVGTLHRDLKPDNILIQANGSPIVLDWGLARRADEVSDDGMHEKVATDPCDSTLETQFGERLGSPAYMSPEQAAGRLERVGARTDVYGLGSVLFEILSGGPPHKIEPNTDSKARRALFDRIATEPSPEPRHARQPLPDELRSICAQAMAVSSEERYGSAQEVADDIERWIRSEAVHAHRYSVKQTLVLRVRRHPQKMLSAMSIALLLAITAGAAMILVGRAWDRERAARGRLDATILELDDEQRRHVETLVETLLAASPDEVGVILDQLVGKREVAQAACAQAARHSRPHENHIRLRLALAMLNEQMDDGLYGDVVSRPFVEMRHFLSRLPQPENRQLEPLWNVLESSEKRQRVLNTAIVIHQQVGANERWRAARGKICDFWMRDDPYEHLEGFRPSRDTLGVELFRVLEQLDHRATTHGRVASILASLAEGNPDWISRLIMAAPGVMAPRLDAIPDDDGRMRAALDSEISRYPYRNWLDDKIPNSWQANRTRLNTLFDGHFGVVADRFALCPMLSWEEFDDCAIHLTQSGYRPCAIRPYTVAGQVRVAAVWVRDGGRWVLKRDQTADELLADRAGLRSQGLRPADLAIQMHGDVPHYTTLWVDVALAGDRELHIGIPPADNAQLSSDMRQKGFRIANAAAYELPGRPRYYGIVWNRPANAQDLDDSLYLSERIVDASRVFPSATVMDIRPVHNATSDMALLHGGADYRHRVLYRLTPDEHFRGMVQLSDQGFRPQAVSVHPGDPAVVSSVWHRPRMSHEQCVNLVAAAARLGDWEAVIDVFQGEDDQALLYQLIVQLSRLDEAPQHLTNFLTTGEHDSGMLKWIVIGMGLIKPTHLERADFSVWAERLSELYRNHPDRGVHGACHWTLERWMKGELIDKDALAWAVDQAPPDSERQWYVDRFGHTMAIFRPEGATSIGSWLHRRKAVSDPSVRAAAHQRLIPRVFAVATTEVTFRQFAENSEVELGTTSQIYSRTEECPQNHVSWYAAAQYCNRLSEQAGIPEDQWCFRPNADGNYGPGMSLAPDYLGRRGYRLPTEAEWEYACRAGSDHEYTFGNEASLLSAFAWYRDNSQLATQPVSSLLPNRWGMFDMHGNVWEWCLDGFEPHPVTDDVVVDSQSKSLVVTDAGDRVLRGGAFIRNPAELTSWYRAKQRPGNEQFTIGFRVARTMGPAGESIDPGGNPQTDSQTID